MTDLLTDPFLDTLRAMSTPLAPASHAGPLPPPVEAEGVGANLSPDIVTRSDHQPSDIERLIDWRTRHAAVPVEYTLPTTAGEGRQRISR